MDAHREVEAAISDLVRIGWFGLDGPGANETTVTFADACGQAAEPLIVIAAWTYLAVVLATGVIEARHIAANGVGNAELDRQVLRPTTACARRRPGIARRAEMS